MKKRDKADVAREIHHRVKNNLQIIASILRLQMRGEESPAAQSALSGAINRINGMVQVHDLLSRTDAKTVDLKELLERLVDLNIQTFLLPGQVIHHKVTGISNRVDADTALNVTLAANVTIAERAFLGIGATVANGATVAPDTFVGADVLVTADTDAQGVYVSGSETKLDVDSKTFMRVMMAARKL